MQPDRHPGGYIHRTVNIRIDQCRKSAPDILGVHVISNLMPRIAGDRLACEQSGHDFDDQPPFGLARPVAGKNAAPGQREPQTGRGSAKQAVSTILGRPIEGGRRQRGFLLGQRPELAIRNRKLFG